MTDEELAAIRERWNWILLDALPTGSEAKADVRALVDAVTTYKRVIGTLAQYHPDWYSEIKAAFSLALRND